MDVQFHHRRQTVHRMRKIAITLGVAGCLTAGAAFGSSVLSAGAATSTTPTTTSTTPSPNNNDNNTRPHHPCPHQQGSSSGSSQSY
ncbi:MAG: hypothetical protein ACXVFK_12460 [Solirubrobacteraceae bacterium]